MLVYPILVLNLTCGVIVNCLYKLAEVTLDHRIIVDEKLIDSSKQLLNLHVYFQIIKN